MSNVALASADRGSRRGRPVAAVGLAVVLIALAACGTSEGDGSNETPTSASSSAADATPEPTTPPFTPEPITSGAEPAPADINFAQMMIGHHMQAIELAEMAYETSTNPELLALAERIHAAQSPEISQMSYWVTEEWGYEVVDPADHEGHDMPGMLTRDELADLAQLTGVEFDRTWLESMIFHHEGAVFMAEFEIEDGQVPEVVEMAQEVVDSQTEEIAEMQEMADAL